MDIAKLDEQMKVEIDFINKDAESKRKKVRAKYTKLKKELEDKKPKRKTIPKSVKDKLWNNTFGREAGTGPCYCCQETIDSKSFHAGHIVSVHDGGGNNVENLKPICATCNLSMGTQNLEEFKQMYYNGVDSMECDTNIEIKGYNECNNLYSLNNFVYGKQCNRCGKSIDMCNSNNYEQYRFGGFKMNSGICNGYISRQCNM